MKASVTSLLELDLNVLDNIVFQFINLQSNLFSKNNPFLWLIPNLAKVIHINKSDVPQEFM